MDSELLQPLLGGAAADSSLSLTGSGGAGGKGTRLLKMDSTLQKAYQIVCKNQDLNQWVGSYPLSWLENEDLRPLAELSDLSREHGPLLRRYALSQEQWTHQEMKPVKHSLIKFDNALDQLAERFPPMEGEMKLKRILSDEDLNLRRTTRHFESFREHTQKTKLQKQLEMNAQEKVSIQHRIQELGRFESYRGYLRQEERHEMTTIQSRMSKLVYHEVSTAKAEISRFDWSFGEFRRKLFRVALQNEHFVLNPLRIYESTLSIGIEARGGTARVEHRRRLLQVLEDAGISIRDRRSRSRQLSYAALQRIHSRHNLHWYFPTQRELFLRRLNVFGAFGWMGGLGYGIYALIEYIRTDHAKKQMN